METDARPDHMPTHGGHESLADMDAKSTMTGNDNSLNDVKRIKNQVATDVQLLRNRVRMLQQEHERAQKKIDETSKKTDELITIRTKNDMKF